MAAPRIRSASVDDAHALAALRWAWSAAAEDRGFEAFARAFAEWMAQHRASHRAVLAEADGAVIGMAWVALTARPPGLHSTDRRSADLQSVFVLPAHRGSGLGERLVAAAIERARGERAEHVTVHATPEAARFYERFGFTAGPTIAQLDLRG